MTKASKEMVGKASIGIDMLARIHFIGRLVGND